ncbi:MAG TPA: hypothetical protein VKY74_02470, partial [Chloroflexia bacterium]|nr:hypothetical protein [Chloroflexia bacterium]
MKSRRQRDGQIGLAGALLALGVGGALLGRALAASPPADTFADPAFEQVWGRTDFLVASHQATRAWYWGPAPGRSLNEIYDEGPGHIHHVQYFDKSRMEINNPSGDPTS